MLLDLVIIPTCWSITVWRVAKTKQIRTSLKPLITLASVALVATTRSILITEPIDQLFKHTFTGNTLKYVCMMITALSWSLVCIAITPKERKRRHQKPKLVSEIRQQLWTLYLTPFTLIAIFLLWQQETQRANLVIILLAQTFLFVSIIGIGTPTTIHLFQNEKNQTIRTKLGILLITHLLAATLSGSVIGLTALTLLGSTLAKIYYENAPPILQLLMAITTVSYLAFLLPAKIHAYLTSLKQAIRSTGITKITAELAAVQETEIPLRNIFFHPDLSLIQIEISVIDHQRVFADSKDPPTRRIAALIEKCKKKALRYNTDAEQHEQFTGEIGKIAKEIRKMWNETLIKQAYDESEKFVKRRSRSFRTAAKLLPPKYKQAAWATYAFFRTADDLVDETKIPPNEFRNWRNQTKQPIEEIKDPIVLAWVHTREKYRLNSKYEQDLLDGLEMDLVGHRYETLEELQKYCYQVASTPGLLCMPVFGFKKGVTAEEVAPYAVKMGIALQLTNLMRDIKEDLETGRIYLPKQELERFGLTYSDIERKAHDQRFIALMKHLAKINRRLYAEAWPLMKLYSGMILIAGGFGAMMSRTLLDEIEERNFDVFNHRIQFSPFKKLWILLTKWPSIVWPETADKFFKPA